MPDLLLINIDLVNGAESIRGLLCMYPTKIIAMVASFHPVDGDDFGMVTCLEMPFSIVDLQGIVTSTMAAQRL